MRLTRPCVRTGLSRRPKRPSRRQSISSGAALVKCCAWGCFFPPGMMLPFTTKNLFIKLRFVSIIFLWVPNGAVKNCRPHTQLIYLRQPPIRPGTHAQEPLNAVITITGKVRFDNTLKVVFFSYFSAKKHLRK